ncbi:ATP-dependent metalloprotease, partial [Vibrio sp. 10N.222.52.B7]
EEGEVFLGRGMSKAKHVSDETTRLIDEEIRILIDRNYARAKQILEDNMDLMHSMKDALMKYETIDAGQIDDLMDRKTEIREPAGWGEQVKAEPAKEEAKPEAEVKSEEQAKA